MSYNSDIDLRLGETPKTDDPKLFADMVDVYNAIHILSQYLNASMKNQGSGDENTAPWDAMPFRNYFYTEAARSITTGSVVTVVDYNRFSDQKYGANPYSIKGAINGAVGFPLAFNRPTSEFSIIPTYRSITGLALSDAEPGQLVKIGVGPAIIKMEGIELGEPIFAYAAWVAYRATNPWGLPWAKERNIGDLIRLPKEGGIYQFASTLVTVGRGVAKDSMMFCPPENWNLGYAFGEDTSSTGGGGGGDN